ncbi:MAG: hypothetical protein R3D02_13700 [Hyphomicrobiales bacterium]
MTTRELAPPAVEPVTIAEARDALLLDHDADDVLIAALIRAARQHVERETRRALIARSFRRYLDVWPSNRIVSLSPAPLRRVLEVRIHAGDGTPELLDGSLWLSDLGAEPGRMMLRRGVMALPGQPLSGIEIDFEAGYGTDPADVPEELRRSLLALVVHWYEHRSAVVEAGGLAVLPHGIDAALAGYRLLAL